MDLAIVGLGRMGANMARRLHRAGHRVVAYNRSRDKTEEIVAEGLEGAFTPAEVVEQLPVPRVIWLMVPAGDATEATLREFAELLAPGDTVVDGGNANFHDSKRRHEMLKAKGIHFVDAGISGGVWGLTNGYGTMVGGDREAVEPLEPVFLALAPEGGYVHCGPPGAGHYTKMVHNGIEYGLMQAYAEGFDIFDKCEYELDNAKIAHLWMQGSVVRSWLCELAAIAFEKEGNDLENLTAHTADSGEGRWTIEDAMDKDVPTPVITAALFARFYTRGNGDFTGRVLSALRNQFGGHTMQTRAEEVGDS